MPSSIFFPRSAKAPDNSAMAPILMTPGSAAAVREPERNRTDSAATVRILFIHPPEWSRCYLSDSRNGSPAPENAWGPDLATRAPQEMRTLLPYLIVRPTVPEPVSDEVARIRFGWTGVTVVGSSRPVAPRMSRVQAPSASTVAMPNSWPVAEPSSYVRLMVWFGTLLEPVTTQRFLSVRNSALDTITVSESTAFTVTVAMFADWAPALSTARYVNVYVPAAAALKVTTPPAPAVAVAPAGWGTIATPTMARGASGLPAGSRSRLPRCPRRRRDRCRSRSGSAARWRRRC